MPVYDEHTKCWESYGFFFAFFTLAISHFFSSSSLWTRLTLVCIHNMACTESSKPTMQRQAQSKEAKQRNDVKVPYEHSNLHHTVESLFKTPFRHPLHLERLDCACLTTSGCCSRMTTA
jgi:hypothetical protein